jgi:hypothetical protein
MGEVSGGVSEPGNALERQSLEKINQKINVHTLADARLKRMLAKSMCRRYQIVANDGGDLPCEDQTPCTSMQKCTVMAEGVIAYTQDLKKEKTVI